MFDYVRARTNMVEGQLRTNGLLDAGLIHSFRTLPRELFVEPDIRAAAYTDADLALPGRQFLLAPLTLAKLLQAAGPRPDDKALVIGDPSGYAAALLSDIVTTVDAPDATDAATLLCHELGFKTPGKTKGQGYTLILAAGAVHDIPAAWLDLLSNGGRLVTVVRKVTRVGTGVILERDGVGDVSRRTLFDATTPYLSGYAPQPAFQF